MKRRAHFIENPTRTEATLVQYRKRLDHMRRLVRSWRLEQNPQATEQELAVWMGAQDYIEAYLHHEAGWSHATARVYRAAILEELRDHPDFKQYRARMLHEDRPAAERNELRAQLKAVRSHRRRKNPRTSQQKAKGISWEKTKKFLDGLLASQSRYGRISHDWYLSSYYTGLRPGEWKQSELKRIALDGKMLAVALVVKNAKATNGRAHGETRTIDLSGLPAEVVDLIGLHLALVQRYVSVGQYDHLYQSCRQLIRRIADSVFPKWTKHPTLYSARHQFAANCKTEMDQYTIAALMGHGSANTAVMHYARRGTATGGVGVSPSQQDVAAVKLLSPPLRIRPEQSAFSPLPKKKDRE